MRQEVRKYNKMQYFQPHQKTNGDCEATLIQHTVNIGAFAAAGHVNLCKLAFFIGALALETYTLQQFRVFERCQYWCMFLFLLRRTPASCQRIIPILELSQGSACAICITVAAFGSRTFKSGNCHKDDRTSACRLKGAEGQTRSYHALAKLFIHTET